MIPSVLMAMRTVSALVMLFSFGIFLESCGRPDSAGGTTAGTADIETEGIAEPAGAALSGKDAHIYSEQERLEYHANRLLSLMTLNEKCAQVFIISVCASSLSEDEAATLKSFKPGGIIFFKYNIPGSMTKLTAFTADVRDSVAAEGIHIPPFIAVDHEGGVIHRFGDLLTKLPKPADVAAALTVEDAGVLFRISAEELADAGITMNLAPVLEPLTEETASFLTGRSFGANPETAGAYGGTFIEAMEESGVLAVAKHFPGSGGSDPHAGRSVIDDDTEAFEELIAPFRSVVERGKLRAIMMSHAYADGVPATMSDSLIGGLLRRDLGFRGIVISDDLIMSGLSKSYSMEEAAVLAVAAGCDMLIYSGGRATLLRDSLADAVKVGRLPISKLDGAVRTILIEKLRLATKKTIAS